MPKPKKVAYRLITEEDSQYAGMHRIVDDLVHAHHSHLRDAKIALAWHKGWKADTDGRVVLGKCKKASDLDRQLADFDFVILLNREFWTEPTATDAQRRALIDHELCHAEVVLGEDDEPVEDELGRICYRMRKHDIEEFAEIVERHGLYKRDLEQFAAAMRRGPKLFDEPTEAKTPKPKKRQPVEGADEAPATH